MPCTVRSAPTGPRHFVVLLLCAPLILGAWSPPGSAAELELDDLFGPSPHGQIPSALVWRPGTDELLYTWDDGEGDALWLFDAGEGTSRRWLHHAELDRRAGGEAQILGFDPSGEHLLLTAEDDLHTLALADEALVRRTSAAGEEEGAAFSPDGRRLAYARDEELYVLDLASGEEKRLSHDGERDVVFNGITDWVYWEEIWGRDATGFWWSGDGERIAYYHIDDREVAVYPLVDTSSVHPVVEHQRYPKSGDPLPEVEIRVVEVASGETVRLDTHPEGSETYLARVHWHPDHRRLAVERLNRDQTRLDILLCNAGDGECDELHREEHPTWVNLSNEFTWLEDGSFLWSSERDGWRALEHRAADGSLVRRLTPEGWALVSLDAVDEATGRYVVTAYATAELGAAERHVFEGRLDGSSFAHLTQGAGWHTAVVSDTGYWVETVSDADTPPQRFVRHFEREKLDRLPYEPPPFDPAALPQWKFFTIPGPDGSRLPAQLLMPAGFDPSDSETRYPVITYHYGGPGSQVVAKRWPAGRLRALWHKMLASQGYAVFSVDNQASAFFGKAGEDKLHRRFGEVELAGQLAGAEYLESLPWVDPERIGLWGWSGGGSHTLYSLFRSPGTWAAGISGAPVTDWHYYDAIWMERYLDHPQDNADGYKVSAPLNHAAGLEDPLLLIHGTADNNVHPQNTYNLIRRLIDEGKQIDLLLYPGQRHSLQTFDEASQRHLFDRMTAFFDQHLRP